VSVDEKRAFQAAALDIISRRTDFTRLEDQLAVATDVDPFVEAHLLNIRTTSLPGSEAAVRRNIEDLVHGTPDYKLMSKDLAETTRLQLLRLQDLLSPLGPVRSVTFKYVSSQGLDLFDVTMANGSLQSGIFVDSDGKIETMWIRPMAPAPEARSR
jgi:hypothetical protein